MNVRNNVSRILLAPKTTTVENEFDQALIETELGDVFVLLCAPVVDKLATYVATIYRTAVLIKDDEEDGEEKLQLVINTGEPVYSKTFSAVTPFFKRCFLSELLECIENDNADTWENLKKYFGGYDNVPVLPQPS